MEVVIQMMICVRRAGLRMRGQQSADGDKSVNCLPTGGRRFKSGGEH